MILHRLLIWLFVIAPGLAQGQTVMGSIKVKSTNDFEVKGDSSSAFWKTANWTSLTYRGGERKYETKVKMLYSETGLYCLFYCEDEKITSTMKEDFTDLYLEDVVEVFFWPDEKSPVYFEYELSPNNFELPIIVPNNKGNFLGWLPWHYEGDRKTRHAAHRTEKYWTAEFFIPYKLLKPLSNVPPSKGMSWRCNFYRLDYDAGTSRWSWQLTGKNFHDYEKFGTIVFD